MGEPKGSHVLAAYPFVVRVFGRGACATSMCVIDVFEIGTAWHRGLRWEKAPRADGATRLVLSVKVTQSGVLYGILRGVPRPLNSSSARRS